ncbi:MAG: hypothetical protein MMC33_006525 [Icmadophila ericetorum]|nr:hypothetical protein [Icmadophila ericetorum]
MSPADPDGDSNMRSSSSDTESEAMFPDHEVQTETPSSSQNPNPNANILAQFRQAELSPPSSQDHQPAAGDDVMDISGPPRAEAGPTGSFGPPETFWRNGFGNGSGAGKEGDEEQQPGYSWKNVKAREELHRAMETVEDKHFNLREFGDLFEIAPQPQNGDAGQ